MCVSKGMTIKREVAVFLILKCVIIQRTAVLCLFWTRTDTDGFDLRGLQNQGPLSLSTPLSL